MNYIKKEKLLIIIIKNLLSKFYNCVGEMNSEMDSEAINNSNDNKCIEKRIPLDENFLK